MGRRVDRVHTCVTKLVCVPGLGLCTYSPGLEKQRQGLKATLFLDNQSSYKQLRNVSSFCFALFVTESHVTQLP